MGRVPTISGGVAYRCLHHHLRRPVFSNIVINNVISATSSANEWYVRRVFIMLFSTSSMFELHVILSIVVIFNILKINHENCIQQTVDI
jgi:hypothetical protein